MLIVRLSVFMIYNYYLVKELLTNIVNESKPSLKGESLKKPLDFLESRQHTSKQTGLHHGLLSKHSLSKEIPKERGLVMYES